MTDAETESAALEAKKAAFLAKLADPPPNVASELATVEPVSDDGEEAGTEDADDPKASPTSAPPASAKSADSAKNSDTSAPADVAAKVVEALKAGDLDTVAELTGADSADFDERSTKWAARNRREAGLRKEIETVKTDIKAVLEHYEPFDRHLERYDQTRDVGALRDLLEYAAGEPWATLAPRLGLPASAAAVPAPRRAPAAERVLLEAVRDDVPDDHVVRQLPGWEDRVVAILRENLDEATGEPNISFKQAAARAVRRAKDEHARLAPLFGGATPPKPGRAPTPERADGATPSSKRKLTREEFLARFDSK
jgi:hypothetical protein